MELTEEIARMVARIPFYLERHSGSIVFKDGDWAAFDEALASVVSDYSGHVEALEEIQSEDQTLVYIKLYKELANT